MTAKKYYMVLDTETTSNAKMVYDIAYTIIDRKGNTIKQANYLVKEIIEHPFLKGILMRDKFSANKYQNFYANLYTDRTKVRSFLDIRRAIRAAIREYNCVVVAYNAEFDFIALEAMAHDLGKKSFFTKSTQIWDLQNIAMWNICNSRNYEIFCDDYNFLTDGKNRKCSAEVVYRYITQEIDFEEAHTALADTEIEAMILFACLQRHKKLHTEFVGKCWTHPVWKTHCKK